KGEYPYSETYTKGLEIEFIEGDFSLAGSDPDYEYKLIKKYLKRNAKKIDVLNLYHFKIGHVKLLAYYKFLNKSGVAYLKMDSSFKESAPIYGPIAKLRSAINHVARDILLKKIDIISVESKYSRKMFSERYHYPLIYIPNGFCEFSNTYNEDLEREDFFLTVGRLGSYEKNTESLIRAFEKIHMECNWNLVLVGSVENGILSYIDERCRINPSLRDRIIYKGVIEDKRELQGVYENSKVFIMNSRAESFCLAVVEALSNGCHLILTNKVAPYREFTDSGKYGSVIPIENDEYLAEAMLESTKTEWDYSAHSKYAHENFSWEKICGKLNEKILIAMKKNKGQ
ncbi:MAG: glycosyltransferase family 4 protein, partial [Clostridium sp.]|nr:glycosyltransferase family 4 protein [Clostridium sp.]